MQKAMLGLTMPLLLLAACNPKPEKAGDPKPAAITVGEDGNVSMTADQGSGSLAIDVPGFQGKMRIPGLDLNGDTTDIDGMKLYPGTKMAAINVAGHKNQDGGKVDMRFTAPGTPDKIAAYYAAAARDNDFTAIATTHDGDKARFSAKKPDGDPIVIVVAPAAGGSSGVISIQDQGDH